MRSRLGRRAHNCPVGRSGITPATKYRRFPRLFAYAQAADQHVWVGGLSFMGRVCGVLLNSCIGQKGRRARARAGRYAAVSRLEAGSVRGLHRACPVQRHAAALLNGARSYRHLGGADRRSGGRRRRSLLPPLAVVWLRAAHDHGVAGSHRGADLRSCPYPPPVPRIGEVIGKRHRAGVTGSGQDQGVCALDGGHRAFLLRNIETAPQSLEG